MACKLSGMSYADIVGEVSSMIRYSTAPSEAFQCVWRHRTLLWQLIVRDVVGRYRGSVMGLLWSFLNPLLMLVVYTFVFRVVLAIKWPQIDRLSNVDFGIVLFAALIVHGLFAECVTRAPTLIVNNPNFVKKVVFPLELLSWTVLGTALFHALVSITVLVGALLVVNHYINWTILLLPIVLAPLVLVIIGLSWFLAALGVFVRDIGQATGILSTALLFLSPAFFPVEIVPAPYRTAIYFNPLTLPIEQVRQVLIWGTMPDWYALGQWSGIGFLVSSTGFWWFQRARPGFADVL
jgi:lipopolysaccharide transport system permease protein